jgi:hypothetical protein
MKRVKSLLLILGIALIVLTVIGLLLPDSFSITRKIMVKNSPSGIYPQLNTMTKWSQWTVFSNDTDNSILYSYQGPMNGIGSTLIYDGEKVGNGRIVIVDSEVNHALKFDLFVGKEHVKYNGEFILAPLEHGTEITLTLKGNVGYHIGQRFVILFIDKILGVVLDHNLEKLKDAVEATKSMK